MFSLKYSGSPPIIKHDVFNKVLEGLREFYIKTRAFQLPISAYFGDLDLIQQYVTLCPENDHVLQSCLETSVVCRHRNVVLYLLNHGATMTIDFDYQVLQEMRYDLCMKRLIYVYIRFDIKDPIFENTFKWCGLLRRQVNTLQQMCRKNILIYSGAIPSQFDADFKFDENDFNLWMKRLNEVV
jgi:hypothetical protein